ncbi:hypothetical protein CJ195_18155 [Bacillus sp. UMB0899]|nr:hypothetical protein CJ195_18155 [Bacillus sp. UMB0899]
MIRQTSTVVKRIECVYFPATNTEDSANWYTENLGLQLLRPVQENQAQLGISPPRAINVFNQVKVAGER